MFNWAFRPRAETAASPPFLPSLPLALQASGAICGGALLTALIAGLWGAESGSALPAGFVPGALIGSGTAVLSLLLISLVHKRRWSDRQLTLQRALDALPDGFVLYDADDRVIMANRRYRDLHPENPLCGRPGARFEDVFRRGLAIGEVPAPAGDLETVIRARVARHRNPGAPFEQRSDARWLRISEQKTAEGGIVAIHTDITALKAAEAAAQAARAQMADFATIASDWFWETDAEGRLTFLSENSATVTGAPVATRIGRMRVDLVRANDPSNSDWDRHLADVAARKAFKDFLIAVEMPNGVKHLNISGMPRFGRGGEFLGYRGATRDATRRVTTERELGRQHEIRAALIENLPLAVSLVGPDLRYLAFNTAFLSDFCLTPEDLKPGDPFEKFIHHLALRGEYGPGDVGELVRRRMARVSAGQPAERFEIKRTDGRIIEVRILPLADGGFVSTRSDVTEDRHRQRELDRKNEELVAAAEKVKAANAAKSLFLANMSHELRTPLNAILGFSEILTGETVSPLTPKFRDYARDIYTSGNYLLRLINDVLDISKVEAGQLRLHEEPVDLAEVVRECERLVRDKAREGGIEIELGPAAQFPPVIADRVRLKQVLLNLLANAVKFTRLGGRVAITASRPEHGGLTIVVADTGIGMTATEVPLALMPFRQVDHSFARRYDGTGLGLPLAKNFTELHGGRLTIRSEKQVGTEVEVWLPAHRLLSDAIIAPPAGSAAEMSASSSLAPQTPGAAPPRRLASRA